MVPVPAREAAGRVRESRPGGGGEGGGGGGGEGGGEGEGGGGRGGGVGGKSSGRVEVPARERGRGEGKLDLSSRVPAEAEMPPVLVKDWRTRRPVPEIVTGWAK